MTNSADFVEFLKIIVIICIFYLIAVQLANVHILLCTLFLLNITLLSLIIYNFSKEKQKGEELI